jgi:hypothetical protein
MPSFDAPALGPGRGYQLSLRQTGEQVVGASIALFDRLFELMKLWTIREAHRLTDVEATTEDSLSWGLSQEHERVASPEAILREAVILLLCKARDELIKRHS